MGKREGYKEAQESGGMWTANGVYMYSEFEKSVDKLIYVYADEELKGDDCLKVGSCKSRRTTNSAAITVARHPYSGRIADYAPRERQEERPRVKGATKEEGW